MTQKAETWVEQLMAQGFNLPAPPAPEWNALSGAAPWAVEELDFEQLDQLAAAGLHLRGNYPHCLSNLPKSK